MTNNTPDTLASKAGRVLASIDEFKGPLLYDYEDQEGTYELVCQFFDDVASVAASALSQKEPAGDERAEFEAWAVSLGLSVARVIPSSEHYNDIITERKWHDWQAASPTPATIPLEDVVTWHEEQARRWYDEMATCSEDDFLRWQDLADNHRRSAHHFRSLAPSSQGASTGGGGDVSEAALAFIRDEARQPCSTAGNDDMEVGCCRSCRARTTLASIARDTPAPDTVLPDDKVVELELLERVSDEINVALRKWRGMERQMPSARVIAEVTLAVLQKHYILTPRGEREE